MKQPITYGLVVAACVFFVGFITGLGGSLIPNVGFSILMGLFAALCFWALKKFSGRE